PPNFVFTFYGQALLNAKCTTQPNACGIKPKMPIRKCNPLDCHVVEREYRRGRALEEAEPGECLEISAMSGEASTHGPKAGGRGGSIPHMGRLSGRSISHGRAGLSLTSL